MGQLEEKKRIYVELWNNFVNAEDGLPIGRAAAELLRFRKTLTHEEKKEIAPKHYIDWEFDGHMYFIVAKPHLPENEFKQLAIDLGMDPNF